MNGTACSSLVPPLHAQMMSNSCVCTLWSVVRDLALDQIDPSLAIGFYCRDKDDFDDFCSRASELVEKANGAPLFTVVQSIEPSKQIYNQDGGLGCSGSSMANDDDLDGSGEGEEEWQILWTGGKPLTYWVKKKLTPNTLLECPCLCVNTGDYLWSQGVVGRQCPIGNVQNAGGCKIPLYRTYTGFIMTKCIYSIF